MDPLFVLALALIVAIGGVCYTFRMAKLERRGQLAHRGSIRRKH